jgi:hypothetical protein
VDPGGERDRGVWASERVYWALIRLYPEEMRRRYAEEMVRYFGDLCREEWHSRGAKGMVLLWARTLPDLVFSVLKERGTMFTRSAYLPVAPGTAARWGALSALLGGSLGVALILANTLAIFVQLYWLSGGWFTLPVGIFATLLSVLGTFGLYGTLVARSGRPDALALSGATLAALSAVSFLALYAYTTAEMLGWLWTPSEGMSWWEMYRTMLLHEGGMGAYALGLLLLGASAFRARLFGRLRALPLVVAPLWPASIGLLKLFNMSGMEYLAELSSVLPFFGTALLGWVMLKYHATEHPAAAGGAPGSVSEVGNHASTSGERATPAPHRPQRQWSVPRGRADWFLVAISVLLMCVGAYAVRNTLHQIFRGLSPLPNAGPLSDESQRLGPQKSAGGARVTLKRAYAEEKAVVVGVIVEDLEGDRSIAGHPPSSNLAPTTRAPPTRGPASASPTRAAPNSGWTASNRRKERWTRPNPSRRVSTPKRDSSLPKSTASASRSPSSRRCCPRGSSGDRTERSDRRPNRSANPSSSTFRYLCGVLPSSRSVRKTRPVASRSRWIG